MWITWQQAAWIAVVCAVVTVSTWRVGGDGHASRLRRGVPAGRAVVREVGIVAGLYALWQWVFARTVTKTAGGLQHGRDVYAFEQSIHLPSELTVQRITMHSRLLIEGLNRYYAYVHVPALGIMIVWLFFRHRSHYPRMRNVLALTTGACLAIQSIPVAPPRFLPDLGFVDTALLYNQSVYGSGGEGISNQLAAMPSVHVAWSTIVAAAVIVASSSRLRWLVLGHPFITWWAIVATGNHWWMDGIVAVALFLGAVALTGGLDQLLVRRRGARSGASDRTPDAPPGSGVDRSPVGVAGNRRESGLSRPGSG